MTPAITGFVAAFNNGRDDLVTGIRKLIEAFGGGKETTAEEKKELEKKRNRTGKPGSPVPAGGPMITDLSKLNLKNGVAEESKEGISQSLYDILLSSSLSGKTITSLRRGGGAHSTGKAADLRLRDTPDEEALSLLNQMLGRVKDQTLRFAQIETGGDVEKAKQLQAAFKAIGGDPNKIVTDGTGYHLHIEALAKGGITSGVSIAGEAGPEAVIPLPDGRTVPVKMDTGELGSKMDTMIALLRDQLDNSGRMLHAIQ